MAQRIRHQITDLRSGGSSPSGRTQARLAQWESARPTPGGRRSDSFAEHGDRGVVVCTSGCEPESPGSVPGGHPKRRWQSGNAAARKAVASRHRWFNSIPAHSCSVLVTQRSTQRLLYKSSWPRGWAPASGAGRTQVRILSRTLRSRPVRLRPDQPVVFPLWSPD